MASEYFGTTTVLATFVVNVSGSFALGMFMALVSDKVAVPVEYRALVAVGLLGGFTTFSTFSFDVVHMAESGEALEAGLSVAGNVVLGLAAAYLGILAGRSF